MAVKKDFSAMAAESLKPGTCAVTARLVYDLNRYNSRGATGEQTLLKTTTMKVSVVK